MVNKERLVETLTNFIPKNVCLTNRNVSDDTIVPLECSMGELRALSAALRSLSTPSMKDVDDE